MRRWLLRWWVLCTHDWTFRRYNSPDDVDDVRPAKAPRLYSLGDIDRIKIVSIKVVKWILSTTEQCSAMYVREKHVRYFYNSEFGLTYPPPPPPNSKGWPTAHPSHNEINSFSWS